MNSDAAIRLDTEIVQLFDAEGLSEFDRIGFLEVMKFRLENVWLTRYHTACGVV